MSARPPRSRLLGLTALAASTDAVCYLGLGHVFPANMTGNTVLLALDSVNGDQAAALRSVTALAGFVLGAVAATVTAPPSPRWNRATSWTIVAELAVLATAGGWWAGLGARPTGSARVALVAALSVAMGVQSGAVRRLATDVTTTYITGVWTSFAATLGGSLRRGAAPGPEPRLRAAVLITYLAAALVAAAVYRCET